MAAERATTPDGRPRMQPLARFPAAERRRIRGVLFDIDDTLTSAGRLTATAYRALQALNDAGLITLAITGRPAGWCDHIARMWPVDGVVGENGAFYFHYVAARGTAPGHMIQRYCVGEADRRANRRRLAALETEILAAVPGSALASDQGYRDADLAIDFCEDVARLPPDSVARIVAVFEQAGANAKVSSVHVNGWFGDYDKLTTTRLILAEVFGIDLDRDQAAFVFAGDSPNDAPMFGFFDNAVGVANVVDFLDQLSAKPTWVTTRPSGAGFAELAAALLAARAPEQPD